ncbi:MAG: hypothetical protein ACLR6J_08105 [Parabacteroides merdae]
MELLDVKIFDKDHPTATTDDEFWKTMNECENALGNAVHGRKPDMVGMI